MSVANGICLVVALLAFYAVTIHVHLCNIETKINKLRRDLGLAPEDKATSR